MARSSASYDLRPRKGNLIANLKSFANKKSLTPAGKPSRGKSRSAKKPSPTKKAASPKTVTPVKSSEGKEEPDDTQETEGEEEGDERDADEGDEEYFPAVDDDRELEEESDEEDFKIDLRQLTKGLRKLTVKHDHRPFERQEREAKNFLVAILKRHNTAQDAADAHNLKNAKKPNVARQKTLVRVAKAIDAVLDQDPELALEILVRWFVGLTEADRTGDNRLVDAYEWDPPDTLVSQERSTQALKFLERQNKFDQLVNKASSARAPRTAGGKGGRGGK